MEKGRPSSPCALGNTASYNIGDPLPGARSGRHKGHKPPQDQEKSPETIELRDFTAGGVDLRYNVGTLPSSHKSCDEEMALHTTQREAPETPESRELNNITLESGEFGYNVGNPLAHTRTGIRCIDADLRTTTQVGLLKVRSLEAFRWKKVSSDSMSAMGK